MTMHTARIFCRIVALSLVLVGSAWADTDAAARRLFAQLAQARLQVPVSAATARVTPTLVNHLYALADTQGRALGYFNEAGTLWLDARGAQALEGKGARALNAEEVVALRVELMAQLRLDALVKLVYGNGGGRRVLMFSALDCPYCRRFEDTLSFVGDELNTTFYIVPSSLLPIADGGLATWQKVARIWCAENGGNAWQGFWSQGSIPSARSCEFADPQVAEKTNQQVREILRAVGVRISAVPQFVREDGVALRVGAKMELSDLETLFGAKGRPALSERVGRWLVGSKD
ncbi:MAG TPA: thioredoxin fold domain-containing protein, partial [Burkholderiaceae bacterium]